MAKRFFFSAAATLAFSALLLSCSQPRREAAPASDTQQQSAQQPSFDYGVGSLRIGDLRATGGVQNGAAAAYLSIANVGDKADTLLAASSPACATTEIHEMIERDGVMTMQAVQQLPIAPAQTLTFKPGGTHIMLMNLKNSLRKHDSVEVVLTFARTGDVTLSMPVR